MKMKNWTSPSHKKWLLGLLGVLTVSAMVLGSSTSFFGAVRTNTKPMADLVVSNVYVDDAGRLTVEVGNKGTADVTVTSGATYIYIDGNLEWTYSWSTLSDKAFLTAGGISKIQPQVLEGEHSVRAC